MRWIILLVVLPCVSFAQSNLYTSYGHAATSWTAISKATTAPYIKIHSFTVYSDSTAGDTLWVAFNADTTAGRIFPVLHDTSVDFPDVYINTIRIKGGAGSLPYRVKMQ
jgi:hemolysin-activating ACP:hemolysin acyltransferase